MKVIKDELGTLKRNETRLLGERPIQKKNEVMMYGLCW